jgi:trk system potassium uptake protein TrkA
MEKGKVFAVFGLGTFGREVCQVLAEQGGKVIAVDNQPRHIEMMKNTVAQAYLLDSRDAEALSGLPLGDIDVAVVAIGENVEASLITAARLKNAGIPHIVARAVTDIHQQILKQIGVQEVINLEVDEGRRVASRLIAPEVLEMVSIAEDFSIVEVFAGQKLSGKGVEKLDLRKRFNLNVLAIRRQSVNIDSLGNPVKNETVLLPESAGQLIDGDVLILLGRNKDIESFRSE